MGLSLSSLGLGTYLGPEDAATDEGYEAVAGFGLTAGINVFDTAINYRGQRSERAIGRAVARAIARGEAQRDEVFVATKGGYLPHDAEDPRPARRYVQEMFLAPGLAPEDEIAQSCHCMAPSYLRDQIDRSRANLGLETIDLYYLHNIETQRPAVDRDTFRSRLVRAIETLEEAAGQGKIAAWGLATWDGLRVPPEHPEHLAIEDTLSLATEVSGAGHHFRGIQLPVNLGMAHALVYRSQAAGGKRVPALEAARHFGLAAFGSASLLQGRLSAELPEEIAEAFPEEATSARRGLQFARSAPGLTAALVGVSSPQHARENFGLAKLSPADPGKVLGLFA